jgi:hypothetical protein
MPWYIPWNETWYIPSFEWYIPRYMAMVYTMIYTILLAGIYHGIYLRWYIQLFGWCIPWGNTPDGMGAHRGGKSSTGHNMSAEASEAKNKPQEACLCRRERKKEKCQCSRPVPKDKKKGGAWAGQPPAEPDHRSGKNVRSSPPSARKIVIVLSGAEDPSAQPEVAR